MVALKEEKLKLVGYFSAKLDPVAAGLPATEKAVIVSHDLVGYSDLTPLVPHAVSLFLNIQYIQTVGMLSEWYMTSVSYGNTDYQPW